MACPQTDVSRDEHHPHTLRRGSWQPRRQRGVPAPPITGPLNRLPRRCIALKHVCVAIGRRHGLGSRREATLYTVARQAALGPSRVSPLSAAGTSRRAGPCAVHGSLARRAVGPR
ncbi:hypothetical protein PsYK624_059320 [Phanerochaete sordida]|uniref:Uncharacterized protein n=1 Tax=Phanerochaete sordida TaxID=48140 RepID=A0A9P3G5X4_9APHY|nr:hypothetical protein PsYK624_059320 [Phanerochaete sordida]